MLDQTQVRSLLLAQFGMPKSLYVMAVERLRAACTMFEDNIKLSMRQIDDEQWARLPLPYLMVFPTVTRIRVSEVDQPTDEVVNPRSITFVGQFDGRGTEHEWVTADDIELAEKQLIMSLVNWQPAKHFKPTLYAGMRVEGTRIPHVKVSFVFQFFEHIVFPEQSAAEECGDGDIIERLTVRVGAPCPPICDPCTGEDLTVEPTHGRYIEPEPPGARWPMIGGWPYPSEEKND